MSMQSPILRDQLQRPLQDLRISVIDACNFRCSYCMPLEKFPDSYPFLKRREWLTFDEITRLVRLFRQVGTRKIRLTGGEPLLRKELHALVAQLTALSPDLDLSLTTNGSHLATQAADLRQAGLQRLNVSLDALDDTVMAKLNGRPVPAQSILDGIAEAERVGFSSIKINMVVIRGINDHQVLPMVERFRGTGHILRFIEYMDVGNINGWKPEQVVSSAELLDRIAERYLLEPADPNYYGEVAERYCFTDGSGELGFISSVSQPFCGTCTRTRISAEGKLYTCLFATSGLDLRQPMRDGADDAAMLDLISRAWLGRRDRYSEERAQSRRPARERKVEMYHIGG